MTIENRKKKIAMMKKLIDSFPNLEKKIKIHFSKNSNSNELFEDFYFFMIKIKRRMEIKKQKAPS